MPAEVLVMCSRCGRPGPANRITCEHCHAELPDAPFVEGAVSARRRLLLSARRLEWASGDRLEGGVDIASLRRVSLEVRPVYEALAIALLFALASGLAPWTWARWPLAGLAAAAVIACVVQRRFSLVLEGDRGRIAVPLGIAPRRSELARRVESIWATMAPELTRLGPRAG